MRNPDDSRDGLRRRQLLQGFCALGFAVSPAGRSQVTPGGAFTGAPAGTATSPPELDDRLVFAFGEQEGQPVRPEDLGAGAKQTFAWAMQPGTGTIRSGTRLHQIVLIRLDPSWLSEGTRARSVDGIVAYSGVCTHTGCDVTDWNAELHRFQCPCHESQFDPGDGARVIGGPAPWPLAALPLKLIDGELAVAGPFEGRVGFQQPGLSPFGI
jgi:Rieske Fe-S protein